MAWSPTAGWNGEGWSRSAGGVLAPTTLNPADKNSAITLSNGNLTATDANFGAAFIAARSIASVTTGLYYFEVSIAHASVVIVGVGIVNSTFPLTTYPGHEANGIGQRSDETIIRANLATVGNITATWGTTLGDGVDVALDATARGVYFRNRGGLWNNSGTANPATHTGAIALPTALLTGPLFVAVSVDSNTVPDAITINFGATAFIDTPPAGYGNIV